jgi:hypothetical protein
MKTEKKTLSVIVASSMRQLVEKFNDYNKNTNNPILREDVITILRDNDQSIFYLIYCK